jgi:hypothetical protein
MISYANWLINNNYTSTASGILWPIIHNDLSYVAEYWYVRRFLVGVSSLALIVIGMRSDSTYGRK